MFGLSIFAFIGNHLAVLYLLKATSATSTLVFGHLVDDGVDDPKNPGPISMGSGPTPNRRGPEKHHVSSGPGSLVVAFVCV